MTAGLGASGNGEESAGQMKSPCGRVVEKKRRPRPWHNKARSAAILAAVSATCAAAQSKADVLYWGGGSASLASYPNPPGVLATGTWDTSTSNWFTDNGSGSPSNSAATWPSGSTSDIASFGYGTAVAGAITATPTVTLTTSVSAGGMNVNANGNFGPIIENASGTSQTMTLLGTGTSITNTAQININDAGGSTTYIKLQNNSGSGGLNLSAPDGFAVTGSGNNAALDIYTPASNNTGVTGPIYINRTNLAFAATTAGFLNAPSYNIGFNNAGGYHTGLILDSATNVNSSQAINFYGGNLTTGTGAGAVQISNIGLFSDGLIVANGMSSGGSLTLESATPFAAGVPNGTLDVTNLSTSGGNLVQTIALAHNTFTTGPGSSAPNPLPWLTTVMETSAADTLANATGFGYFDSSGHLQTTANGALDGTNTANYTSGAGGTNNVQILANSTNVTSGYAAVDLSTLPSTVSVNTLALSAAAYKTAIILGTSQVLSVTDGGIVASASGNGNQVYSYIGVANFTSGTPTGAAGQLTTPASNLYISSDTSPANGQTIQALKIAAQIAADGNSFNLVKGGECQLDLNNTVSNNFTGETFVNGGSLNLNSSSNIIDIPNDVEVRASGTLFQTNTGNIASTSNLTVDPFGTYALHYTYSQTLANVIANGAVGIGIASSTSPVLTAGGGTLTISGELSGTGVVSEFTSGANAIAANAGTVSPGSDGTIGQLTFQNSGSAGTSLELNHAFNIDLHDAASGPGTGFDQLLVSDASSADVINLNGAALNVNLLAGYSGTYGSLFDILANTAGDTYSGTFAGLPDSGDTFTVDGETFAITYSGSSDGFTGTGNDIVLEDETTFVPEPNSASLLCIVAAVALLSTGRRRRHSAPLGPSDPTSGAA